jgi:4-cresol dehydrogenase (hydroxylating)
MNPTESAILKWSELLGPEYVLTEEKAAAELTAVCGTHRKVPCILRPKTTAEVQQIVQIANEFKIPLHPVSCGRNWGMGSRLPVKDGTAVVDLCRMNRIVEVNSKHHYAVIEPGVTQRQLYDYLEENNLPLMINVTGSTSDTSLIGNALDRGVGYFTSRADALSNLEVVLGNGKTIKTGFGHYENAKTANIYKHGVGPSFDGLFAQSNYGIVTSACCDLMQKMPHMACIARISDESQLPRLIDALAKLKSDGIIQTVIHVGNKMRSKITITPLIYEQLLEHGMPADAKTRELADQMFTKQGFGPWSAMVGILGTPSQLRVARKEIKKALRGVAPTVFLTDPMVKIAKFISEPVKFVPFVRSCRVMLGAIEPLYNLTKGIPTDAAVKSTYWPLHDFDALGEMDPDQARKSGLIFCLPILPIDGQTVADVMQETRETFKEYGFEAFITVNLMDTRAMECVISLGFNRCDAEQVKKAHECIQKMEKRYVDLGVPPYRLGINSMHQVLGEDSFWETAKALKGVLDPNNIIAPGHYNIV